MSSASAYVVHQKYMGGLKGFTTVCETCPFMAQQMSGMSGHSGAGILHLTHTYALKQTAPSSQHALRMFYKMHSEAEMPKPLKLKCS